MVLELAADECKTLVLPGEQVSAVTAQDSPAGERASLRGYLERLLGWDDALAVEHALRSVDLAAVAMVEAFKELDLAGDSLRSEFPNENWGEA